MDMLWWHWAVMGLVLAGLEIFGPGGFFIIFFGVGALAVALLGLVGLSGPLWVQWLLFSFFSVVSLMLFRSPLLRRLRAAEEVRPEIDAITGEMAAPIDDIPAGAVGRVELRGTTWSARNVGDTPLARGQRCRVVHVDGLLLSITAEGAQ
jgi:membrane protein implicated in regulation of membrane protease activity